MKDEGQRQLAAKSAGVAASKASKAALDKMDIQHKNVLAKKADEKVQDKVLFNVTVPAGCKAVFCIDSFEQELYEGENRFSV